VGGGCKSQRMDKVGGIMFWKFFIPLFFVSFIFPYVYAILSAPNFGIDVLVGILGQADKNTIKRKIFYFLSYPLIAIGLLANVYILLGWSASVATWSSIFAFQAKHKWLYYVVGFIQCHGPLGYMGMKSGSEDLSKSFFYVLLAMTAFIVFCIWPRLMFYPYGWFLDWAFIK
jgi:hypothetical protein